MRQSILLTSLLILVAFTAACASSDDAAVTAATDIDTADAGTEDVSTDATVDVESDLIESDESTADADLTEDEPDVIQTETVCDDGLDDDEDGAIDCEDDDCADDPACQVEAVCGDDMVEGEEECDGDDSVCGEDAYCTEDCLCGEYLGECGDGLAEGPEACDTLDAELCGENEFCNADCACEEYVCGNDLMEGTELCDGTDIGTCGPNQYCQFCMCWDYPCGNGIIEGLEECEVELTDCGYDAICDVLSCACDAFVCGNGIREGTEACDSTDVRFCGEGESCSDECACLGETSTGGSCPDGVEPVDLNAFSTSDSEWNYMGMVPAVFGNYLGTCTYPGGGAGGELVLSFVPPVSGTYYMSTDNPGSVIQDTILFIQSSCDPSSSELACNDDIDYYSYLWLSDLTIYLEADVEVFIVIDGWQATDFFMNVDFTTSLLAEAEVVGAGDICDGVSLICGPALTCSGGFCIEACPLVMADELVEESSSIWSYSGTIPGEAFVDGGAYSGGIDCTGGGGSNEITIEFTAPDDGAFRFSTNQPGTTVDTVLYLLPTCLPSPVLACNDDVDVDEYYATGNLDFLESELVVDLFAGESIVVVIDGWSSADHGGLVELLVTMETTGGVDAYCDGIASLCEVGTDCIDNVCTSICHNYVLNDFEMDTYHWQHSDTLPGLTGEDSGYYTPPETCSPTVSAGENTYHFTAPVEGSYMLSTNVDGTEAFTTVYAQSSCGPTFDVIACDLGTGDNPAGSLTHVYLAEGEEVIFVVDGQTVFDNGIPYSVEVLLVGTAGEEEACDDELVICEEGFFCVDESCRPGCPTLNLNDFEVAPGIFSDQRIMRGTSGVPGGSFIPPDDCSESASFGAAGEEWTYSFTATETGTYRFTTNSVGSSYDPDLGYSFDSVLYIQNSCEADSLAIACNDDVDIAAGIFTSELELTLLEGSEVVIVVDAWEEYWHGQQVQITGGLVQTASEGEYCDDVIITCGGGGLTCIDNICQGPGSAPTLTRFMVQQGRDINTHILLIEGSDADQDIANIVFTVQDTAGATGTFLWPVYENEITYYEDNSFSAQSSITWVEGLAGTLAFYNNMTLIDKANNESGSRNFNMMNLFPLGNEGESCPVTFNGAALACSDGLVCRPSVEGSVDGFCEAPTGDAPTLDGAEFVGIHPANYDGSIHPNCTELFPEGVEWRFFGTSDEAVVSHTVNGSVTGFADWALTVPPISGYDASFVLCFTAGVDLTGESMTVNSVSDEAGRVSSDPGVSFSFP